MASVMHQRMRIAAAVYLRTVHYDGSTVTTQVIAAKTQVASIKKQSIPLLELLGATILARLLSSGRSSLQSILTISHSFYWGRFFRNILLDKKWEQYVQHHVNEIRHISAGDIAQAPTVLLTFCRPLWMLVILLIMNYGGMDQHFCKMTPILGQTYKQLLKLRMLTRSLSKIPLYLCIQWHLKPSKWSSKSYEY